MLGQRKRILVVDDEPDVRRAVAGILADNGFDVHTALDADHALRSAIALSPDMILLDVRLPDESFSLRFAEEYRRRVPSDEQAPIIALSGTPEIAQRAKELGAIGHISKPFEAEDLLRIVRSCIALDVASTRARERSTGDTQA